MVWCTCSEWCKDWQPPPLPHHSSQLFHAMYSYIMSNSTHKENFHYYHEKCKIALPEVPITSTNKAESTTQIADSTKQIAESTTGTLSMITSTTPLPVVTVKSAGAYVPILIALLVVCLVMLVMGLLWWKHKRRKRGRANLVALPMEKYEATNYLDNKARNNQCWNKQEPDQSKIIGAGSLDKMHSNDNKVIMLVEPIQDILTDKLVLSNSLEVVDQCSESKLDQLGCQNLCFMSDNGENGSPVSSMSPLLDDIDGAMLPNVPEISNSLPNDKQGNVYTSFPEVNKSENSDIVSLAPLPTISSTDLPISTTDLPISTTDPSIGTTDTINPRNSHPNVSSPKRRKKRKSSL